MSSQQQEKLNRAFAYWKANPVEAIKDWFGVTPEDYQAHVLNALFSPTVKQHSRVAVKSGHGVGKTTTEAWAGWFFLMTRPHSKVICTAPTQPQLNSVLWPEFSKWYYRMPSEFKSMWNISTNNIKHSQHEFTWFATARTSNKQDNMQGFHEDHIMVICEEASGIPEMIFEPIEGILSNAEETGQEAILLIVGNPTQIGGEFHRAFHKNKELYERFTISGDKDLPKDPNGGHLYISPRVSQKYRDTMARKYGADSGVYDVRVRGIFPREADDVVIPMAWADKAQYVRMPHFDKIKDTIRLVMDPARFGTDETVLGTFRGRHCINMDVWPKTSTSECIDILYENYFERADGIAVTQVIVDEPGVGGGVVDGARRAGIPVTPYHGGLTLKTDVDPAEDVRMFANRRSRDWWNVRRMFERQQVAIPANDTLVDQLASVKYDYFNDKIKVETKKEMRERLGEDASPDRADVIVMGLAPYASLGTSLPQEVHDLAKNIMMGDTDRPSAFQDWMNYGR